MSDDLADGLQLAQGVGLRVEHDVVDLWRREGKGGVRSSWIRLELLWVRVAGSD